MACHQNDIPHQPSIFTANPSARSHSAIILGGELACRVKRKNTYNSYGLSITIGSGSQAPGGLMILSIYIPPQWIQHSNTPTEEVKNIINFIKDEHLVAQTNNWNIIIGGDFNCINKPSDAYSSHHLQTAHRHIHNTLLSIGLIDTYAFHHPTSRGWTRFSTPTNGARLDYLYACQNTLPYIRTHMQPPQLPWSDHEAVTASFTMPPCLLKQFTLKKTSPFALLHIKKLHQRLTSPFHLKTNK
jgi:exonuclease III